MTVSASSISIPPYEVDECRGVLRVYSDGSIWRSSEPPFNVPVDDDGSALWKDVLFHPVHNLQLRIYKPTASTPSAKLPIFYFIHGGGYCIGSRAWPNIHNYCLRLASELEAVVISPDYRLAPENKLPAAIEDGFMAVKWLQAQALAENPDPWLTHDAADFSKVFVSGDSAGGNIAHNLAVQLGAGLPDLAPVQVKGYVLFEPFFGGTVRTRSEAEGPKDAILNLDLIDRFWRLSTPIGATTDHPLINPFGLASPSLEHMKLDPILVLVAGSDLLKDRQEEYAQRLKKWRKKVEYAEFEGQQHCFFTINTSSEPARSLMKIIKRFITENSN
ncbi:hypothetical protein PTKIN_Ptkin11bG0069700 [Pterospermum kingtungense]